MTEERKFLSGMKTKRHGCGLLGPQFLNVGIRSGQLNYEMRSDYVKVWEGTRTETRRVSLSWRIFCTASAREEVG